jgi:hypothetical protein
VQDRLPKAAEQVTLPVKFLSALHGSPTLVGDTGEKNVSMFKVFTSNTLFDS